MRAFSVKVRNKSVYETRALARLFRLALKEKALTARRYTLVVVPSRHSRCEDERVRMGGCHGRAMLGGRWAALAAPPPEKGEVEMPPRAFAWLCWVLDHEVLHLAGFKHGDMKWHDKLTEEAVSRGVPELPKWARGLPSLTARPREVSPEEQRSEKIAHAEAMLVRAERRVRRAEALSARWRRKLAALQRAHLRLAGKPGSAA